MLEIAWERTQPKGETHEELDFPILNLMYNCKPISPLKVYVTLHVILI